MWGGGGGCRRNVVVRVWGRWLAGCVDVALLGHHSDPRRHCLQTGKGVCVCVRACVRVGGGGGRAGGGSAWKTQVVPMHPAAVVLCFPTQKHQVLKAPHPRMLGFPPPLGFLLLTAIKTTPPCPVAAAVCCCCWSAPSSSSPPQTPPRPHVRTRGSRPCLLCTQCVKRPPTQPRLPHPTYLLDYHLLLPPPACCHLAAAAAAAPQHPHPPVPP